MVSFFDWRGSAISNPLSHEIARTSKIHLPVRPAVPSVRFVPDVFHILLRKQFGHRFNAIVSRVFRAAANPKHLELLIECSRIGLLPLGSIRRALLERRRDPGAGLRPGADPLQLARESWRSPGALYRGGGKWSADHLHLPAERKSSTRSEVRLQIGLVRTLNRTTARNS
jgi:hypothetical protein